MNTVGNRFVARVSCLYAVFWFDLLGVASNQLHASDNRLSLYPGWADCQFFPAATVVAVPSRTRSPEDLIRHHVQRHARTGAALLTMSMEPTAPEQV